jgi:hypothetical protein
MGSSVYDGRRFVCANGRVATSNRDEKKSVVRGETAAALVLSTWCWIRFGRVDRGGELLMEDLTPTRTGSGYGCPGKPILLLALAGGCNFRRLP